MYDDNIFHNDITIASICLIHYTDNCLIVIIHWELCYITDDKLLISGKASKIIDHCCHSLEKKKKKVFFISGFKEEAAGMSRTVLRNQLNQDLKSY